MSKPDPAVIEAIFDSYLQIRNSWWKLVNEDCTEINVIDDEKARIKALTTAKFISEAKKCKTTGDWLGYLDRVYEAEQAEMKEGVDRWFFIKVFADIPLLGHTLRAIGAYIFDQIKDEQHQTSITAQMSKIDTHKEHAGYHRDYVSTITFKRDHRGLNEKSFEDFVNNVSTGKRKPSIARLLLSKQPDAQQEQQATEHAAQARREEEIRRATEDARRADELRAAEIKEKADIAEKARREDETRRVAEEEKRAAESKAKRDEAKRAADKARHEDEARRRAEDLQRIHAEEERLAKVRREEASRSQQRARRISRVQFDPGLFAQPSQPQSGALLPTPMEIDANKFIVPDSTLIRRSTRPSRK